jgi:hypothetical protein
MLFGLLCFCYVGATEKIHDVKVQVYWELPPSRMKEAEKLLVPGLELSERGKGERVAPIVIIAGAAALAYIVRAAIEIYRDAKYGGVVLSVKDDRLRIENDVRLPSGIVIVRNKDNVQVFSTSRQNEGEILAKLAPLLQTK